MRRAVPLIILTLAVACTDRTGANAPPADEDAPSLAEVLARPPSAPPHWISTPRPGPAPQRIVALAPGLTETLFALGAGPRVVGTSRFADYPPPATKRPKVGGLVDLDVEAVLALRPDLVLAIPGEAYRRQLETLARADVPVLVVPGSSIADFLTSTATMAATLGLEREGRALRARVRAALETARPPRGRRPRIAIVYGWQPLFLAGPGSFPDELLALLGAQNVVQTGPSWTRWSPEALLAAGPEVLFDATGTPEARPRSLDAVPAIAQGRTYPAPDALKRPGPRLPEAAEALRRRILARP